MSIQQKIREEKRAINQSKARVMRLLAKYPDYQQAFKAIMSKHEAKAAPLGQLAPWYQKPVESLSAVEPAWYESSIVSDLFDFGTSIAKHERIAAAEQKELEIELQMIAEKNEALDKQLILQKRLEESGTMTRAVGTRLQEMPWAIPALIGLSGLFIFLQMGKKK